MSDPNYPDLTLCRQAKDAVCRDQRGQEVQCGYAPDDPASLGACREVCIANLIRFLAGCATR
jgi:hypothetical protein